MVNRRGGLDINKITFLIVGSAFITITLIARLFYLQVISHSYFEELATREQYGFIDLPAQRGEIVMKDYHSGEEFLLGTNTTLNRLFVDPALVKDPVYIADKLAPLIFNLEEEQAADNERIYEAARKIPIDMTEEDIAKLIAPLSDIELEEKFRTELIEKVGSKQREEVILRDDMEKDMGEKLKALNVGGIEVIEEVVYAYPPIISNPSYVASEIADYVEIPSKKLSQILKGENRYVVLQKRLHPDTSDAISEMIQENEDEMFKGLGFQEEYFRYYPEGSLASNIVGYVSRDNVGQYGIESSFNTDLQGVAGKFQTKRDSIGRQITVGDSVLEPAVDGDDIVLTIDRSVQLEVEKILSHAVWAYQADSGQVIVQNPQTGAIIAMAHAPSFDPNNYGEVFKKIEINFTPEEVENLFPSNEEGIYYFYKNEITLDRYQVFEEKDEKGNSRYYRYENFVGPEVYHNKIVSWPYEPGSVFKTIAMAIGIDDGDITPNTTYNDVGPVGVDWNVYSEEYDFEIKNSDGYFGLVNMTTVLAESLNTGMTFIAKKMGGALFYSYLDKFGFLDRTDIEFDSEAIGKIDYFEDWTESELATHAFGQGMTVTMIQLANAYSAVVNGGVLMQPYIVEEVRHDNETITSIEPHEIRRVISEDTSAKMVQMLTNSVENGVANAGGVHNHYVGGKTGTSQTYKHGVALSGSGTTITSFAGFGPVDDPQFVILIKFDRPRSSEWGSSTAAPVFNQIATYLFDYYNLPPDK
ncbi:penicillin-binding protein 2 [Candidatus Peregrinibacteria bacterium]|jgi:cell division protein FtsI/penicillin-binding protein 2|nr:penicillin-binding protein 2 [Candidatus Peregrinibacteria bacterium]MBT7736619.1 penicillin-binding protein 2 [Candidatus Peregrinibacteria bacterium]